MKIEKTNLDGVLIITPDVFADERGWFTESFNAIDFAKATDLDVSRKTPKCGRLEYKEI